LFITYFTNDDCAPDVKVHVSHSIMYCLQLLSSNIVTSNNNCIEAAFFLKT